MVRKATGPVILALVAAALFFLRHRGDRPIQTERREKTASPEGAPPQSGHRMRIDVMPAETAAASQAGGESETSPRIEIRTIDESGDSVREAQICLMGEDAIVPLGLTDNRGVLIVDLDLERRPKLEARKAGHATSARTLDVASQYVVMRLERAVAIRGRVHRHDGAGVGPGIKVLALPAGEVWDPGFFARCARRDPPRHVAVTEEEGRYAVEDTSPEGTYVLFAAGNGLLAGPLPGVRPREGQHFDLVATPVYGACVTYTGEDGGPVESPDLGFNEYFEHVDTAAAPVIPLGPWTSSVFLLGLAGDAFDAPSRRLLLFLPKDHGFDGSALGPVFYRTSFPGYRQGESVVWAEPVHPDVPVYSMVHHRLDVGLGSIEVELVGSEPSGGVQLHQGAGALAKLQLIALSPENRDIEIELENLQTGRDTARGIPYGEYAASVLFRNGSYSWPRAGDPALTIGVSDSPARILIDTGELGRILLDVRWPDGTQYQDGLTVDLGEGEPRMNSDGSVSTSGGNAITFRNGPFLIQGLVPGTYSVKVRRPLSAQPDYRPIVVATTARETSVVSLVMKSER